MLLTRFWQRGAETSLALQNPIPPTPEPHAVPPTPEPISNPEPAPPSLDEPDPGVFHHEPTKPTTEPPR
jgi:hypothetical protein